MARHHLGLDRLAAGETVLAKGIRASFFHRRDAHSHLAVHHWQAFHLVNRSDDVFPVLADRRRGQHQAADVPARGVLFLDLGGEFGGLVVDADLLTRTDDLQRERVVKQNISKYT